MRALAYVLIGVLGGMGVMSLSQKGGPSPPYYVGTGELCDDVFGTSFRFSR